MPDVIEIAEHVLELVPEAVIRENLALPIAESTDALMIAAAAPVDFEIIEKLRFILNRRVLVVPTTRDWIEHQIDKHFGSVDDADAA